MYRKDGSDKYGVLNNFDLSLIMKPSNKYPNCQCLARTGTLPFMTLELLEEDGFCNKISWPPQLCY